MKVNYTLYNYKMYMDVPTLTTMFVVHDIIEDR